MVELLSVIHNRASYRCSCCGYFLFDDDDVEADQWQYCPFCGMPLYEQKGEHSERERR